MDQRAVESRIMKKLTKLAVFSIWVLSVLFSSILVTHTIDKNYVFLFCNGLLAFVVRHSGLINSKESSGKFHQNRASESYNDEFEQMEQTQEVTETASDNGEEPAKDIYVVQEDRNRGNGDGEEQRTEEEEGEETEDQEEEDDCDDSCGGFGEEEEEDGEENERAMKVEELNKKFEEFIRKMKEELRIEARRHLILV
ncbi:PREDICTED: glutamic acid-rich protein [Tarenaya hassleriana]|uniref:glutamic acid-rich protein n=1 Tax=Tarenaya hassleriana TaxID=28532 RepID=UPI00053C2DC5|nr:PREDICTED: glutamic acid-rich protein [Tarenaya hassleriana]